VGTSRLERRVRMTIFSKARTVGGEAGVPVTEVKSGRSNDFVDSGTKMLFAL